MKCTCNGCIFRTQVKGQQRTQNFGRSRPSGSKIGARTAAVDPCFFVCNTKHYFDNFLTADRDEIFTWGSHHERAFVSGPTTFPQQIQDGRRRPY